MSLSRSALVGLIATSTLVSAGPCDIYASGGTPCIAAHSTTRALYNAYTGSLYQVKRDSDNKTTDIAPLKAGGVANAATQDNFCSGTTCVISIIYDQSGKQNHLTQAPPGAFQGPASGGYDNLASATGAPVTLNGQKAYGVFISPGMGYRNNKAVDTATGDEAQGMYAVFDGTHYNGDCCFDYGNAETSSTDTGNGHMEAIYFGNSKGWGTGAGDGPWIMADLENGLFSGFNPKNNPDDPTISHRFLTAIVKGQPNEWAIRGGDATSGSLNTFYSGQRPNATGYNPMSKEGAIILGIGGDNSNGAQGTFYEGVMTTGYPSDATENEVQTNVVSAKYATTSLTSGSKIVVGSSISLRAAESDAYLSHDGTTIVARDVSSTSSDEHKQQASWTVRRGLGNEDCLSFESASAPGSYVLHSDSRLLLARDDGSKDFREDATFCPQEGLTGRSSHHSIRSWAHPTRYIRLWDNVAYAASHGGANHFDSRAFYHDDASWEVLTGFV
ncbi:hypothetical protein MCOR25_004656 [Pyricularia grisea]|uniref:Alpha-L-arabinofuranosidase n=1 Tax=Pyricularia grisea TaxID=148305 RepID=A0A6P8BI08_PYRGI|nr:uncharacterized protein PgNI_01875 [Pyricularia grisea]KAI6368359.1 hypothetical protein MCOR25_004656 [Pyricularia grisea]TLD16418.1 hypothetical protein PgNI_01875 [Pyricularia grisea]